MTLATQAVERLTGRLRDLVGEAHVFSPTAAYLADETETRGLRGRADLVVRPGDANEVAGVVSACYDARTPIVPRGGGTGFAGGAVPLDGGCRSQPRAPRARALIRAGALAHARRSGSAHERHTATRTGER